MGAVSTHSFESLWERHRPLGIFTHTCNHGHRTARAELRSQQDLSRGEAGKAGMTKLYNVFNNCFQCNWWSSGKLECRLLEQDTGSRFSRFRHQDREGWGGFNPLIFYNIFSPLSVPSDPCKVLSFIALPTSIITLALIGLHSSGHLPSCDMEEEIVSQTTFFDFHFLASLLWGDAGTCPGELSTSPSRGRPGELLCIRMDVSGWSVFGRQTWKDRLDSGSGRACLPLLGRAGSEVGSAAHEQTYYFAIREVCMGFWGTRKWKSSPDRLL